MPLNVQEVTAGESAPEQWLVMLHGIYGAGRNWGSVARSFVASRPDWGALLVDLRQHGGSHGFPTPHTVEAAAADLAELDSPGPVRAVLGHSFGGKVALLYARDTPSVREVWVIDSTPDEREPSGSAWGMLGVLRRLPDRFEQREEAVEALVQQGVSRPIALWMTTNLEPRDGAYRWRIDLDDMEALLRSFFALDLWEVVEHPREGLVVHLVRATESSLLDDDAQARVRRAAETTGRVWLHEVEGGHWLNADNPDAVVGLLTDEL